MNWIKKVLPVIFVFGLLFFCSNVFAENNTVFDDLDRMETTAKGILYTIITDTDGNEHYLDGVFTVEEAEVVAASPYVASYSVYKEERELYKKEFHGTDFIADTDDAELFNKYGSSGSLNGYYTLKFSLDVSNNGKQCFLTGLSQDKCDEVENNIKESVLSDEDFSIEDTSFIDAEKITNDEGADDNMCWAAASSNILYYTGWAAKAGFDANSDEDDVFEAFVNNFYDGAGNAYLGFAWFFNGNYQKQGENDWAQVKDYSTSGGYLKDYDSYSVTQNISVSNVIENDTFSCLELGAVLSEMERGYGTQLGVSWGEKGSGHAVTVWGYVVDTSYDKDKKEYYKALIISDSDSDKNTTDRRTAPNKLHLINLEPYKSAKYNSWKTTNYKSAGTNGIINDFVLLCPYSDDIEMETSNKATKNRRSTVDFVPSMDVGTPIEDNEGNVVGISQKDSFNYSESIAVKLGLSNISDVTFNNGEVCFKCELKKGNVIIKSFMFKSRLTAQSYYNIAFPPFTAFEETKFSELEPGKYTLTYTIDPDNKISEAYKYQNTVSVDFEVNNIDEISGLITDDNKKKLVIYSADTKSAKLIVAGYDENDCICEVQYESVGLTEGNNNIELKDEVSECEYIKVLLCFNDENLIPICESKKFSLQ